MAKLREKHFFGKKIWVQNFLIFFKKLIFDIFWDFMRLLNFLTILNLSFLWIFWIKKNGFFRIFFFFSLLDFLDFFWGLLNFRIFFGFFWLLLKVTKVTTGNQKWPKIGQNRTIRFFCPKGKKNPRPKAKALRRS